MRRRTRSSTRSIDRLLLDTHVWLWSISAPDRLSPQVREQLDDPTTELYLSVAAVWEIAIKHAAGKLRYSGSPQTQVPIHIRRSGVATLGITVDHALQAAALPMHHRDPFDRLMLAQAASEQLVFATANARLAAYGVPLL
jgi:PIN domain nuclease of toxin-antitoxin system